LSGETPKDPVITRTGHVYERSLIAKHLANHHTDPITNEPLSMEELIPVQVKSVVKPRPTTATSIPSMINLFQNEWDALMLETFQLKQQLENTRQELSRTLYEHDAACRVIARLIKERDEARSALEHFKSNYSANGASSDHSGSSSMQVETPTLPAEVIEKMQAKATELSGPRKKRAVPANLAEGETVAGYGVVAHCTPHMSGKPGVTCVATNAHNQIVSGGIDAHIHITDENQKNIATLSGHSDTITSVACHPSENIIISTSNDKTAKVWTKKGKDYNAQTVDVHRGSVNSGSFHPTGDYFITVSSDATAALHDLNGQTLVQWPLGNPCNSAAFHPDGLLLATGHEDGKIHIWDMKTLSVVATFDSESDAIGTLDFSEDGYQLASVSAHTMTMWNLRKQASTRAVSTEDDAFWKCCF